MTRIKRKMESGPYDMMVISQRIERMRQAKGVTVATICEALGLNRWDYSRKINGDRSRFSIEELGAIARLFGAPEGWPFIDEEKARLLDNMAGAAKEA